MMGTTKTCCRLELRWDMAGIVSLDSIREATYLMVGTSYLALRCISYLLKGNYSMGDCWRENVDVSEISSRGQSVFICASVTAEKNES